MMLEEMPPNAADLKRVSKGWDTLLSRMRIRLQQRGFISCHHTVAVYFISFGSTSQQSSKILETKVYTSGNLQLVAGWVVVGEGERERKCLCLSSICVGPC